MITLKEYVDNLKEGQTEIYYASGETHSRIDHLPQVELVKDKGFDILYLTDDVDEFCLSMMRDYDGKAFKNVTQGDLNLETEEEKEPITPEEEYYQYKEKEGTC